MLLLSHSVRLAGPRSELIVEIRKGINAECVQVISRREGFDAQKPWMLNPAGKNKVTDKIIAAHLHRDE